VTAGTLKTSANRQKDIAQRGVGGEVVPFLTFDFCSFCRR
jgi:hypothetical protein